MALRHFDEHTRMTCGDFEEKPRNSKRVAITTGALKILGLIATGDPRTSKHGVEIRGASREYDAMREDFLVGNDKDDVAQLSMLPQHIDCLIMSIKGRVIKSIILTKSYDFISSPSHLRRGKRLAF